MQTGDRHLLSQREAGRPQLSENALQVLQARYLRRDPSGQIVETPEELFQRVARSIAQGEASFGGSLAAGEWQEAFFDALVHLDFLPNSPTLMNAGTPLGQLSACFVLAVEDSMESIFDALKLMALIQQTGGGTGFSFSHLRPRGDPVASSGGTASGPVSFMRIFDCATENIKQGGKRRGANMGVLCADHPDIEEFIDAKLDNQSFRNFNLSVGISRYVHGSSRCRPTLDVAPSPDRAARPNAVCGGAAEPHRPGGLANGRPRHGLPGRAEPEEPPT